jgi:alpha-beta hydrolase superfamily lysophospholipase
MYAARMSDGASFDDGAPDLELAIEGVAGHPEPDGTMRILLQTSRGEIRAVLHPSATSPAAAIYAGGARGGFEGPGDGLYPRMAARLRPLMSGLRLHYREPGEFEECVLDVLAGVSFLRGVGAAGIALVGHSFGGAVVIKVGELSPHVGGVAALSPQLYGTRTVERLGKPLLLVHGMRDSVLDYRASEDIFARAREPKRIVFFPEDGHGLAQSAGEIEDLLAEWMPGVVAGPAVGRN